MTSKERAELKTKAMKIDSIFQVGKSSITPQMIEAIKAALKARELIKISVLKNCMDDTGEIAELISTRTGSQIVQVIGKKIVLYKKNPQKEEKRKRMEKINKEKRKEAHKRKLEKNDKKVWTKEDSLKKKKQNAKYSSKNNALKEDKPKWSEF